MIEEERKMEMHRWSNRNRHTETEGETEKHRGSHTERHRETEGDVERRSSKTETQKWRGRQGGEEIQAFREREREKGSQGVGDGDRHTEETGRSLWRERERTGGNAETGQSHRERDIRSKMERPGKRCSEGETQTSEGTVRHTQERSVTLQFFWGDGR